MNNNGALESPTGTGKTLCLLCATLGWLEHHKAQCQANQNTPDFGAGFHVGTSGSQIMSSGSFGFMKATPKIIYASRTHSQLSQAIAELKRTTYKYMKVTVLGSRDQLCIHPEVSKEPNNSTKLHMCQIRVKSKTCYFHNQVEGKKEDPFLKTEVLDIEDLVKYGKRRTCCPYYLTRELRLDADVIFMPYNYLLDPRTRKAHGIELQGCIVILDEAHNVEKICEESASLQLRSTDVAMCIDEVTQVMQRLQESGGDSEAFAANDPGAETPQDFTIDELYLLKALFLKFEEVMDAIPVSKEGVSEPGSFMFELLEKAEITPSKKAIFCDLLDKLVMYLTNNGSSPFQRKGAGLQKFADLIKIVFSKDTFSLAHMEAIKNSYRVHVALEEPKKKYQGWGNKGRDSGSSSSSSAGQSNTLTSKQGRVLSYWCFNPGFGGNPQYVQSMGNLLLNFSRVIPGGLLVFFPSYPIMKYSHEFWQSSGVWDKITALKRAFIEPQSKDAFSTTMNEFYEKVNDPALRGAIFMAVCRGKVSEGLDFADGNGRAVVVTGLPYPPYKDPRVMLKQQYLNNIRIKEKRGQSGNEWYNLEASRAVNQAIGRVIRHKDDFGAILLADHRFGTGGFSRQLSKWVQPHLKIYEEFAPTMRDLTRFFITASQLCPKPHPKLSYNNKEIKNFSSASSEYEPLPSAPVGSSALSQGPSRIIPKQYGEFKVVPGADSIVLPPKAFGGPRVAAPTSRTVQPHPETSAPKSIFDVLQDNNSNSRTANSVGSAAELSDGAVKRSRTEENPTGILDFNAINVKNAGTSSSSSRYESLVSTIKKRKIKVTANVSKNDQNNSSNGAAERAEMLRKIKAYTSEVKKNLPQDSYKEFSASVKRYQASRDYDAFHPVFFRLFSQEDKRHLLTKFVQYIASEHREDFKARCARLS
ncbi:DEAD2 [Trinorchestia longiramus]|nr:DEAD2 [Trinorchestia longiramus]